MEAFYHKTPLTVYKKGEWPRLENTRVVALDLSEGTVKLSRSSGTPGVWMKPAEYRIAEIGLELYNGNRLQ